MVLGIPTLFLWTLLQRSHSIVRDDAAVNFTVLHSLEGASDPLTISTQHRARTLNRLAEY